MYVGLYVICVWNWNWWLTQDHFLIKHWSQRTHRCSAVRCWPWVFIGAGQPLQHGEVKDTNLAWLRPVGQTTPREMSPLLISWLRCLRNQHVFNLQKNTTWKYQLGKPLSCLWLCTWMRVQYSFLLSETINFFESNCIELRYNEIKLIASREIVPSSSAAAIDQSHESHNWPFCNRNRDMGLVQVQQVYNSDERSRGSWKDTCNAIVVKRNNFSTINKPAVCQPSEFSKTKLAWWLYHEHSVPWRRTLRGNNSRR